jgi:helicase-like protein
MIGKEQRTNNEVDSDEHELDKFISQFYADPLGFVRACFPWGEGALKGYVGPEPWQEKFLTDLGKAITDRKFDGIHPVKPIRMAISSGRGIGKSTMAAFLACWIMSTRPFCKISVTANTGVQLNTKTFAAIKTWMRRCITADWFEIGAEMIRAKSDPSDWMCSAITYNKDTIEGFAGQHAANSSSVYIVDEASAIDDELFVSLEGGLTRGEPMVFLLGNCTRSTGKFFRVNFGEDKDRWDHRCIDARTCIYTNKEEIEETVAAEGEDSDIVRVHVRGLPPRASDAQFIPSDIVREAMARRPQGLADDPLVVGVDISRGGDETIARFRKGVDAYSIPPIVISAELSRDTVRTTNILAEVLKTDYNGKRVAAMFIDESNAGGAIVDRLREMGNRNVYGVNFGSKSLASGFANMRAYMWDRMRTWLKIGGIDKSQDFEYQLVGPGYKFNERTEIVLEKKEEVRKRIGRSPDDADALACTFAATIAANKPQSLNTMRDAIVRHMHENCENSWMA